MIAKNLEKNWKMIKKNIINEIGLENISYCFCGSGLKYDDCCKKKNIEDLWFMNKHRKEFIEKNEDEIKKKPKEKINKKELEKYGRLKTCIHPYCNEKPIYSHFVPRSFLEKLKEQEKLKKQEYKFQIEGEKRKLGANSFRTKLWCESHDNNLFELTDKIGITKLFDAFDEKIENSNREELIGEFFFKALSFKVKTLILDQMYYFLGIILSNLQGEKIEKDILERFLTNYKKYNTILTYFDNLFNNPVYNSGNNKRDYFPNIPLLDGEFGKVYNIDNEGYFYYQSNIKLSGDAIIFITNIILNGNWIYFIGTPNVLDKNVEDDFNIIKENMEKYKKLKDYKGAIKYISDFMSGENIYYLNMSKFSFCGNTYIYSIFEKEK